MDKTGSSKMSLPTKISVGSRRRAVSTRNEG